MHEHHCHEYQHGQSALVLQCKNKSFYIIYQYFVLILTAQIWRASSYAQKCKLLLYRKSQGISVCTICIIWPFYSDDYDEQRDT